MTYIIKIMPKLASSLPANRKVVSLAYDGLCLFEFGIGYEIFGLPRPEMGNTWYSYAVAASDEGPMRTSVGLTFQADGGLELLQSAGTILLPGWRGLDAPVPRHLLAALVDAHDRGSRFLTICSGVFLLAEAGLLSGLNVTTHWRYEDQLRQRYPDINVVPNVLYTDNGQILTSAGSAAGIDLCLHLVRKDFGPKAANSVARRLVVPPHREGGQAQFIDKAVSPVHEAGRLGPLFDYLQENLSIDHPIDALAERVGMSRRTFLRRFEDATGSSPARWLTLQRLQKAKDLLEETSLPLEDLAHRTGFGTAATLRHHFQKQLGTSPAAYRANFRRVVA